MKTDKNYQSHVLESGIAHLGLNWVPPADPLEYSDILKFSQCQDTSVNGFDIFGGTEDCIDCVRGRNYTVSDCVLRPKGERAITFKGAIDGWTISKTLIHTSKSAEIEVGQFDNYWYPGRPPTRKGRIYYVVSSDPTEPVRVKLWDAEPPIVELSAVKIITVPKYIWLPYFLFRYAEIRIRNLFGAGIITK